MCCRGGRHTAVKIVAIVGGSVGRSVGWLLLFRCSANKTHTGSVDCYLGYLLTWSWVVTCVFFFSLYVLIRRFSTVDFSAHDLLALSRVENLCMRVCVFHPIEAT